MKRIAVIGVLLVSIVGLPATRAEIKTVKDAETPTAIRANIWCLSGSWPAKLPPADRVNAPEPLTLLCPGQDIALGVVATGKDRDRLLQGRRLNVLIRTPAGVVEERDLTPVTIRRLKAEGADMALVVLQAGGIAADDRKQMEDATSLVSIAVFKLAWRPADVATTSEVVITATVTGDPTGVPDFTPVTLKLQPWTDWVKSSNDGEVGLNEYMRRHHDSMSTGRLLALLHSANDERLARSSAAIAFLGIALERDEQARRHALKLASSWEPVVQFNLLVSLQLAGLDAGETLRLLPAERQAGIRTLSRRKDPRSLRPFNGKVETAAVQQVGNIMDECWGGWMATGDQSYLRTLVDLLAQAADYPELQSWIAKKGGEQGLNSRVANGLMYQIAGWSIASFQRSDPLVADWLAYWQQDPSVPTEVREQIGKLPTNPAFRRR